MTDKEQIIIDGVDVGGCEYACNTAFGKNGCKHHMMKNIYCSKNPNCYFKQLARKTQEYKELKAYTQRQENQREEYYKEYLKLSQKCEKYEQALDDIEEAFEYDIEYGSGLHRQVLDIINKAKGSNYCI